MVDFEYVGYFNGAEMVQVLNSVAAIMGSDNGYGGLVKAIALGGFLTVMMTALLKLDLKEAGYYIFALAFVNSVMLAPVGRVTVIDKYATTVGAAATPVSNVPLGIAFALSGMNQVGVFLTDLYESNFVDVAAPKFTATGMMFGARLFEQLSVLNMTDANRRRDMGQFVSQCVNPELVDYPNLVEPLRRSGDLVNDLFGNNLGILNPGRVVMLAAQNTPMNCVEAGTNFKNYFGNYENVANPMIDRIGPLLNLSSPRDGPAGLVAIRTAVASKISTGASYIMNQSITAEDQINQSVAVNLFLTGQKNAAVSSGDPATVLATTLAKRSTEQQYSVMRVVAEEALPRLRSMVEYVTVAIFPIVLLIMIAAGAKAMMVLRVYLGILLSINLWAPLYAVVSHLMTLSSTKYKMLGVKTPSEGVMSLSNFDAIAGVAQSDMLMAGMLTLSIPAIALAIVKGGDAALTSAIGGITSPANSNAASAAGQVAAGNFQYGNFNAGNFSSGNSSIGQTNRAPSAKGGTASLDYGTGNVTQRNGGGTNFDGSGDISKGREGLTGAITSGVQTAFKGAETEAAANVKAATAALNNDVSKAINAGGKVSSENGGRVELGSEASSQIAAQIGSTVKNGTSSAMNILRGAGMSESDSQRVVAGLGKGGMLGASSGLDFAKGITANKKDEILNAFGKNKDVSALASLTESGGKGQTFSVKDGAGNSSVSVGGVDLTSAIKSASGVSAAESYQKTVQAGKEQALSSGISQSSDLYSKFANSLPGGAQSLAGMTKGQEQQAFSNFVAGLVGKEVASGVLGSAPGQIGAAKSNLDAKTDGLTPGSTPQILTPTEQARMGRAQTLGETQMANVQPMGGTPGSSGLRVEKVGSPGETLTAQDVIGSSQGTQSRAGGKVAAQTAEVEGAFKAAEDAPAIRRAGDGMTVNQLPNADIAGVANSETVTNIGKGMTSGAGVTIGIGTGIVGGAIEMAGKGKGAALGAATGGLGGGGGGPGGSSGGGGAPVQSRPTPRRK